MRDSLSRSAIVMILDPSVHVGNIDTYSTAVAVSAALSSRSRCWVTLIGWVELYECLGVIENASRRAGILKWLPPISTVQYSIPLLFPQR